MNLILTLKCTGREKKDKEAKVITTQTLWIHAVKCQGEFDRWAFREIRGLWDAKNEIQLH